MPVSNPIIRTEDPRTGKKYAIKVDFGADHEIALEKLYAQMERDYQKTLPPEKRDVANQPTNFECPNCKTHEVPTSRKEALVSGWFLGFSTHLEDVFNCPKCGREFTEKELRTARWATVESNRRAELMEKYKDGEITEEILVKAMQA